MAASTNNEQPKIKTFKQRPNSAIEFQEEVDAVYYRKRCSTESDLDEVKRVAEKLNLDPNHSVIPPWWSATRSGSQKDCQDGENQPLYELDDSQQENSPQQSPLADNRVRFSNADEAICWIKAELVNLRQQDEDLARQLIDLRRDIHRIKLQIRCTEHRELLDDVTSEMEERRDAISDLCDLPLHVMTSPLKDFGITKMNISSRRFSLS